MGPEGIEPPTRRVEIGRSDSAELQARGHRRPTRRSATAALLACGILLSGCATFSQDYSLQDAYREAVIARVQPAELTDARVTTMRERNQVIFDAVFLLDDSYHRLEQQLYEEQATWATIADLAVLGASGAAAVASGEAVKTMLAAAASGITGARIAISRNLYAEASRYALIARMRASRARVLAEIERGARLPVRDYPLSRAVIDLQRLAAAGTLVSAVQAVAEESTRALETERAVLDAVRAAPIPDADP